MGYFLDKLYPRDVLDKIDIRDVSYKLYPRDVSDKLYLKNVSCILYQDFSFSHFYSFEVLLLKDI